MVDPEFLGRIEVFSGLGPADRAELAATIYERQFRKGTLIFSQGDPGKATYFVRSGRVKIYRLTPDGSEQILGVFTEGQPFGLIAAVDGAPYPANAEAADDCRVWVLRTDDLRRFMDRHPALLGDLMREVGGRLRKAQGRVHSLAARSVRQRLVEYLLEQAQHQAGAGAGGPVRVRVTMTHQELGGYLGASRETVTRALADLRREGAIRAEADDTFTLNPAELKLWLEP